MKAASASTYEPARKAMRKRRMWRPQVAECQSGMCATKQCVMKPKRTSSCMGGSGHLPMRTAGLKLRSATKGRFWQHVLCRMAIVWVWLTRRANAEMPRTSKRTNVANSRRARKAKRVGTRIKKIEPSHMMHWEEFAAQR